MYEVGYRVERNIWAITDFYCGIWSEGLLISDC